MFKHKVSILVVIFSTVILINAGCSKQNASNPPKSAQQAAATDLFNRAEEFKSQNELVKAKELYQQIFTEYPNFDKIDAVQQQMGRLNLDLIYSKTMIEGKTVMHTIIAGDTLGKLAKQYGTTIALIKKSNGLKSDVIRLGDTLRVWTAPFNLAVDKSQNVLMFKTGDEILGVYSVATGKDNITPVGEFTIANKLENPTWFKSGAIVAPESPENALGTRWMGFNLKGYGIHGTIEPESIGRQATAGCIRMRNEDVEQLYEIIPLGTKVVVTD